MRLVSSYETTDGKLFMKIEEAVAHQAKIDFHVWYLAQNINQHRI